MTRYLKRYRPTTRSEWEWFNRAVNRQPVHLSTRPGQLLTVTLIAWKGDTARIRYSTGKTYTVDAALITLIPPEPEQP